MMKTCSLPRWPWMSKHNIVINTWMTKQETGMTAIRSELTSTYFTTGVWYRPWIKLGIYLKTRETLCGMKWKQTLCDELLLRNNDKKRGKWCINQKTGKVLKLFNTIKKTSLYEWIYYSFFEDRSPNLQCWMTLLVDIEKEVLTCKQLNDITSLLNFSWENYAYI